MTKKNKNEIAIQLKISKLNCIDDIQAKFHYIKNLKIFLRKINARLLTEILRVKNYLFDKKTSNWLRTSFQILKKKKTIDHSFQIKEDVEQANYRRNTGYINNTDICPVQ